MGHHQLDELDYKILKLVASNGTKIDEFRDS